MERFHKMGSEPNAHSNGIWALARISDSQAESLGEFITGGGDGQLRTWHFRPADGTDKAEGTDESLEAGPLKKHNTFSQHSLPVVHVAVSRDHPVAASTSLDGAVKIWDLSNESAEAKSIQQLNITETWGIAVSADGQRVVTGGANGAVEIIDSGLSVVEQTFTIEAGHSSGKDSARRENPMVMAVALSNDDAHVAIGAHDGTVTIMDVETGKAVGSKMARHGGPVRSIAYLPNEPKTILTGSDDQLINLYDTESGHVTGTCRGHAGMVFSARGSDDGKYLVSGGSDHTVRVWDRAMTESIYSYKGHSDSVWGVSYAASGTRIVSVSDDSRIGVLDSSKADTVS